MKPFEVAWELQDGETKLRRENMSRLEILRSFCNKECVNDCAGEWLTIATNILERNDIPVRSFTSAVYQLLQTGRGK
ncbi:hypothetical protein HOLleu_10720 [Holothuria leucospilota]|uniref:Uncharacterized protein n=1 Tax=Holothuria leucospilota TaxID=206669 RepID=A0A9Q1CEP4_HOLLE|nr:hypothetical protein HOLleu_10720 [Holothuria leucospilota]